MASSIKKFDFTIDGHGTCFIALSERLSVACLSDGEIEYWAEALKADINRVAKRMKKAAAAQRAEPLGLETTSP